MIPFERKYERARKLTRERASQGKLPADPDRPEPELEDVMEKGDMFAMIISALLTILPVALVVLVLLSLAGYFFIVR